MNVKKRKITMNELLAFILGVFVGIGTFMFIADMLDGGKNG